LNGISIEEIGIITLEPSLVHCMSLFIAFWFWSRVRNGSDSCRWGPGRPCENLL